MAQLPPPAVLELFLARVSATARDHWQTAAQAWLTDAERAEALASADPGVRVQRVVGRALMRLTASTYTGEPARDIRVVRTPNGKPVLPDHPGVSINVAHTGALIAVAASADAEVGVDAELAARTAISPQALASRRFDPSEAEYLATLAPELVPQEFLRFWTAKEAVAKALGHSVIDALAGVVLAPQGGELRLVSIWTGPSAEHWTLRHVPAPGGQECVAVALAAPGAILADTRLLDPQSLVSAWV
jgi:4'-phosphopantetheinyl transferase